MVDLAGSHDWLHRAEDSVTRLERRASAAAARLEQVAKAKRDLEHEFAHLQRKLKNTTKAIRNDVNRLADHERLAERGESQAEVRPHVVSAASSATAWHGVGTLLQSLPQRRAFVGGVAGVVLLGVIGMWAIDRPDRNAGALSATLRRPDRAPLSETDP